MSKEGVKLLFFKLNTLQKKVAKLWVNRSHGVMAAVCWIYTTAIIIIIIIIIITPR